MKKINYRKIVLFILLCLTPSLHARVDVRALKGTYDTLNPAKTHISLIFGAVYVYARIISTLYYLHPGGLGNFTRAINHAILGQLGITHHAAQPASYLSPELIANIIIEIDRQIAAGNKTLNTKKIANILLGDPVFRQALKIVKSKYEQANKGLKNAEKRSREAQEKLHAFGEKVSALLQTKKKKRVKYNLRTIEKLLRQYQKLLKQYPKLLREMKKRLTKKMKPKKHEKLQTKYNDLTKQYDTLEKAHAPIEGEYAILKKDMSPKIKLYKKEKRIYEKERRTYDYEKLVGDNFSNLLRSMEKAYEESGYFNNSESPFKYALHSILLAFLYEKVNTKSELQDYFQQFDTSYFKNNKKSDITKTNWNRDIYTKEDVKKIETMYLQTKKEAAKAKNIGDLLGRVSIEQYIFARIMKSHILVPYPQPTTYKTIPYKKIFSFSDCMESTINNVCLVHWDHMTGNEDPELRAFRKKHPDRSNMGTKNNHIRWTEIVTNKPLVAYSRIAKEGNAASEWKRPKGVVGFVPVKKLAAELKKLKNKKEIQIKPFKTETGEYQLTSLTVNKRTYLLFDADKDGYVAYEMLPSLRNFLLLLHRLFRVDLFNDSSLEEVLLTEKFNSVYTKRLLEKKLKLGTFSTKDDLDDDLASDYITLTLKTTVGTINSTMNIHLSSGHASAEVENIGEDKLENKAELFTYLKNNPMRELEIPLLFALNGVSYAKITEKPHYKIIEKNFKNWLFLLGLGTTKRRITAARQMFLKKVYAYLNQNDKQTEKEFFLTLLKSVPALEGKSIIARSKVSTRTADEFIALATAQRKPEALAKNAPLLVLLLKYNLFAARKKIITWHQGIIDLIVASGYLQKTATKKIAIMVQNQCREIIAAYTVTQPNEDPEAIAIKSKPVADALKKLVISQLSKTGKSKLTEKEKSFYLRILIYILQGAFPVNKETISQELQTIIKKNFTKIITLIRDPKDINVYGSFRLNTWQNAAKTIFEKLINGEIITAKETKSLKAMVNTIVPWLNDERSKQKAKNFLWLLREKKFLSDKTIDKRATKTISTFLAYAIELLEKYEDEEELQFLLDKKLLSAEQEKNVKKALADAKKRREEEK